MSGIPFLSVNITALCCFALLTATLLAAKKTPEIWMFLALLADCMLWMTGSILMRLQLWPGVGFWFKVSLMALFSVGWLFYLFLLCFAHRKEPVMTVVWALLTLLDLVLTATEFLLAPPVPQMTEEGTVFLYTFNWHILIACAIHAALVIYMVHLVRQVVRERGIHSPGLLLVIAGGVCLVIGNMLQIGIPGNTFPYDALGGVVFAGLMLFALYKKRMFRMTLVMSRSLLILVLALICALCAAYVITPLEDFLLRAFAMNLQAATIVVALLLSGALFLTYALTRRLTDALFTREEQQDKLLKQFSSEISQTLDTLEIMKKLTGVIQSELPTEQVYVCLLEDRAYRAKYSAQPLASLSFSIPQDSPHAAYLRDQEPYLITSEFRRSPLYLSVWEAEKSLLRRLNIDCMVALKDGTRVIGLVLIAAKDHNRPYSYVETGFLETVTSIASIAIKNAGLYEKMFREARIDSLTGAYNYRYFIEQQDRLFQQCRQDSLALILVDVDDFKLYNQLYGVKAGDQALRQICEVISQCVGTSGTVFRTSGKVFAVLLPHQDARSARVTAEEIMRRVAAVNDTPEGHALKPLTVSIGICAAPYAASSAKELMDNADLACFNAKQGGKDRIMLFRGAGTVQPYRLAERTDAIINQVERGDGEHQTTLAMIAALTAAIDAKDHYTYAHSKNVARYAANLAVAAGLNDEQVRTIYLGGLLHDVGKISIPEDILNKSGKLTDEEYECMKSHVNNSIDMVRHLPEVDYVIPAVLGHHERWDGKGYPRGIAGEEIPISARCLSVADVFDAMTTDRPYRRGLPLEYAVQEILKGRGTQFDPRLAELFVQLVRSREMPLSPQVHQD